MARDIRNFKTGAKASIDSTGALVFGAWRFVSLTTAITANVTTTSEAAGTLAKTSHATGISSIFRSDGTKWQFLVNA